MSETLFIAGVLVCLIGGFLYGRWIRTLDREHLSAMAELETERRRTEKEYLASIKAANQRYEQLNMEFQELQKQWQQLVAHSDRQT